MTEIAIHMVGIETLNLDPKNVKTHSPEQVSQIAASIERFGFNDPVGVDPNGMWIVEGAGRVAAAAQLGITQIPVIFIEFATVKERRAYAIAHNQTQQLTRLDEGLVFEELTRIGYNSDDLFSLGYTSEDVAFMAADADMQTTPGEAPPQQVPTFTIQRPVTTKLNFDSQEQLVQWLSAMDWMRARYPEAGRISERLTALMGQYEGSFNV